MTRFAISVCLASILALSACTRSGDSRTMLNYVPASSYAVLAVKWQSVTRDEELKRIAKGAEIQRVFEELGINSSEVTEFAVFGDLQNSASGSNGIIANGKFNSKNLVNSLLKRSWMEQEFDGKRIYVNPRDGSSLATFDSNLFIFGTRSGVQEVITARAKPELRFTSHPAYKTLSARFDGKQYPILMMVAIPQASQDMASAALTISTTVLDLAGVGPLGDLLNKIGYAKGLGCGISRKNGSFPIEVSAVMKDEDSAQFVAGALNLLKKVASLAPRNSSQRDIEAAEALKGMSIERSREIIAIRMTMPRSSLREMNR